MISHEIIIELMGKNIVFHKLFDEWVGLEVLGRFFTTEKSLRSWEKYLRDIMEKYKSPDLLMAKADTRGIVLVLNHCVVRTYRTALFLKIRPLYRLRNPYLEKCMTSKKLDRVGVFVCKKIKPMLDTTDIDEIKLSMKLSPDMFEQLLRDIEEAIGKIHSCGYCHHDVSLDNTGYDPDTKNFVLFDFDAAKRITIFQRKKLCLDRTSWERSLNTWKKFLPLRK